MADPPATQPVPTVATLNELGEGTFPGYVGLRFVHAAAGLVRADSSRAAVPGGNSLLADGVGRIDLGCALSQANWPI